jgi:hypothetical protein
MVLHQPIGEGWVEVFGCPEQTGQSPGNATLVREAQKVTAEKAAEQMQRGGERRGSETALPSIRRLEPKRGLGLKQVGDPDGVAEVPKVGAAAHAYMLTRIEELPAGDIGEGTGPTSDAMARLQQRHGEASRGERGSRRQAGQSRPDNQYSFGHAA